MSDASSNQASQGDAVLDLRILHGSPDAEAVAALTAVVAAALEELAESAEPTADQHPSAWQRSQRSLRGQITAGPGEWRGFSA